MATQTGQAPEYSGRGNAAAPPIRRRRCHALCSCGNDDKLLDHSVRPGIHRHRNVQRVHTARSRRAQLTDRALSAAAAMRSRLGSEQSRDSIPSENDRPGRNAPDLSIGTNHEFATTIKIDLIVSEQSVIDTTGNPTNPAKSDRSSPYRWLTALCGKACVSVNSTLSARPLLRVISDEAITKVPFGVAIVLRKCRHRLTFRTESHFNKFSLVLAHKRS